MGSPIIDWRARLDAVSGAQNRYYWFLLVAGIHGLRRKWVVERKYLPDADVAAAGGWRSIATMKRSYQLADDAGVLEAVMESRKLREREA